MDRKRFTIYVQYMLKSRFLISAAIAVAVAMTWISVAAPSAYAAKKPSATVLRKTEVAYLKYVDRLYSPDIEVRYARLKTLNEKISAAASKKPRNAILAHLKEIDAYHFKSFEDEVMLDRSARSKLAIDKQQQAWTVATPIGQSGVQTPGTAQIPTIPRKVTLGTTVDFASDELCRAMERIELRRSRTVSSGPLPDNRAFVEIRNSNGKMFATTDIYFDKSTCTVKAGNVGRIESKIGKLENPAVFYLGVASDMSKAATLDGMLGYSRATYNPVAGVSSPFGFSATVTWTGGYKLYSDWDSKQSNAYNAGNYLVDNGVSMGAWWTEFRHPALSSLFVTPAISQAAGNLRSLSFGYMQEAAKMFRQSWTAKYYVTLSDAGRSFVEFAFDNVVWAPQQTSSPLFSFRGYDPDVFATSFSIDGDPADFEVSTADDSSGTAYFFPKNVEHAKQLQGKDVAVRFVNKQTGTAMVEYSYRYPTTFSPSAVSAYSDLKGIVAGLDLAKDGDDAKVAKIMQWLNSHVTYDADVKKVLEEFGSLEKLRTGEGSAASIAAETGKDFSWAGAYVSKSGTCFSYSDLANVLLDLAGVENRFVATTSPRGIPHAIVAVKLDGKWAYVEPQSKDFSYRMSEEQLVASGYGKPRMVSSKWNFFSRYLIWTDSPAFQTKQLPKTILKSVWQESVPVR